MKVVIKNAFGYLIPYVMENHQNYKFQSIVTDCNPSNFSFSSQMEKVQ